MNIRKYYLKFIESAQDRLIISKLCAEANIKEDKLRNELNRYNKANPNVEERLKFEKVKNSLMEKAKPVDNSKYFNLIFKIFNSKDPKETIKLIGESEIKEEQRFFAVVTSYIVAISKNNSQDKVSTVSVKLNSDYGKYKQHINREYEKERLAMIAQKHIEVKRTIKEKNLLLVKFLQDIAKSEYQTSKEYLEANKIKKSEYTCALKTVEENESEVFKEYCTIMVAKLMNTELGEEDLTKLINKIINGIDGRSFDLLDYHQSTKLSLYEMSKICSYGLDKESYRILKTFIGKNMIIERFDIESEINSKYIITMNGIQKGPTNEDKYAAYQYLIEHDYPQDYKLYQTVLKRIIMNFDYAKTLVK